jgi:type I restriction enzyme, S subunit
VRAWIVRHAQGATMPNLNTSILSSLPFVVPPIEEQRAIAYILGTLDDKIELNRRMNETLEEMARAIFKSWFVDFDPVRAKAEGRDPGLPEHIADLFPDSFEDSELGKIPAGWTAGTVGEDFEVTMGQSPPGETYKEVGDGLPFYQGRRDFGFRYPALRVYCSAPKRAAQAGDALVSVRAPVGDVNMAEEPCCIGRGVAAVRHHSGSRSYTYYAMQSLKTYFDHFESDGTVFGSVSKRGFVTIPFLIPSPRMVENFESMAFSIDQHIESNEKQIRTLATVRDTLLPKLISGEVRIDEATRKVEAAL